MGASLFRTGSLVGTNKEHFLIGCQWLENISSMVNFDGVPHSFSLLRGWEKAYPETSGYILSTLTEGNSVFFERDFSDFSKKIALWLRGGQNKDGSYNDLAGSSQIFDTAQIIIGFCHIHQSGLLDIYEEINSACLWLLHNQNNDGSFTNYSYHKRPHTYYSRVGAALIFAGKTIENETFINAGIKNLDWVAEQQADNGWIHLMSFDGDDPYTHNIMYTAEGLLAGYFLIQNDKYLDVVLKLLSPIGEYFSKFRNLPAKFNSEFLPTDRSVCVTGLAQWCCLCQRLDKFDFKNIGDIALTALKSYQFISANKFVCGALPGSVPFYGDYMRFALPNWGVKFFLDALILSSSPKSRPVLL